MSREIPPWKPKPLNKKAADCAGSLGGEFRGACKDETKSDRPLRKAETFRTKMGPKSRIKMVKLFWAMRNVSGSHGEHSEVIYLREAILYRGPWEPGSVLRNSRAGKQKSLNSPLPPQTRRPAAALKRTEESSRTWKPWYEEKSHKKWWLTAQSFQKGARSRLDPPNRTWTAGFGADTPDWGSDASVE